MLSVGESLLGLASAADAQDVYVRACKAVDAELDRCESVYQQMIGAWSGSDLPEARDAVAILAEIAGWVTAARQGIVSFEAPLRVVLLGRTMAGKSSLFCYLTGASRDRIGEGSQATTRAITRLPLLIDSGIEVSDTPGVGALDRPVDRVVALEEARRADVVVWLCTDDSFQAEEQDALEEVLSWGVPVVLALHCFLDLSSTARLRRFLKNRDAQPRQLLAQAPEGGHLARPLRTFRRRGQLPADVISFHAAAALAADLHPDLADDMLEASNLGQLTAFLLGQLHVERDVRRTSAAIDSCRQTLDEGRLRSELARAELSRLHRLGEKARADLERRSALMVGSAGESLRNVAQTRIADFDAWADDHYRETNPKKIVASLSADLDVAVNALEHDFTRHADKLQRELGALGASVATEWAALGAQTVGIDVGTSWHRKLPSRWRAGVATGVVSVAVLALTALGHPWAATAIASAGSLLVDKVPWISGRKAALSQRRAALQEEATRRSEEVVAEMLDHWTSAVEAPLQASVSEHLERWRLTNGEVRELGEQFEALAASFAASTTELDAVLVRALLELEGHTDLPEAVTAVHRVPGAECTVTLDLPPHETAMRMHPHLRGTSFLSASPEPPLAVLTRVLGRRATHGWRAVACRGSSDDEQRLQVVPPSAQLADEARRLAAFATQVLDLPVEARIPPPPVHDNLTTGVSP